MARKSIESRMDRVMDVLLPPGSMAAREYHLPSDLREALRIHRTKTDTIIAGLEKLAPGGAYAAMVDGTLKLPDMPAALRDALKLSDPPTVTDDMSVQEAADLWAEYALGDER